MAQAQDFLTSLLNSSMELDPNTTTGASSLQDRSVAADAILHSINTGQEPTMVRSPSYGPIGDILQKLNIRKSFQPVSPRLTDQIGVARKEYAGAQDQDREEMLKTLQNQGTQFGTESARAAATTLGAPELGAAFPKDVKGKGELVQSGQDIQLQRALMSNDAAEQRNAILQQTAAIREAVLNGQLGRAQQLLDLSKARQDLNESKFADAPASRLSSELFQSLDRQQGEAQKALDAYLAGGIGEESDATAKRLQERIDSYDKKRRKLMSVYGNVKDPADLTKIYDEDESAPAPKNGSKVKPAPAGIFN